MLARSDPRSRAAEQAGETRIAGDYWTKGLFSPAIPVSHQYGVFENSS
jgi:hypothetical protein